jgi:DNA adenine methylase
MGRESYLGRVVDTTSASPFIRWAGSKRWLLPQLDALVPTEFAHYFEPFLGSGSVFFRFAKGHPSHLSDTISPLIECYASVRSSPREVHKIASSWSADEETYYAVRSLKVHPATTRAAARFIYLNRFCFNGLYRENASGQFNVPYGRPKNPTLVGMSALISSAIRLQDDVALDVCDFEDALHDCGSGDFVYLDPPYVAGHRTNGFVDYNAKIFSWADQTRLAAEFNRLDRKKCLVLMTNANHDAVKELYSEYTAIPVTRFSSMAATLAARGPSTELIIIGKTLERNLRLR